MEPLDALSAGAKRIKNNDLGQNIIYVGEQEFEEVCETFNEMQQHILQEQEKNRKYEKARTDMIAGISHDLRTPLTAIRGTIKGLMDGVAATPELQNKFLQATYRRSGDMDVPMNLGHFSFGLGLKLFLIGMVAISAMFLPGISGSTLLLIFGAYIPVISAVRGLMGMDLSYFPSLLIFGCGILAGVVFVVKGIQVCLEKYRPQMVYLILGMMIGSFYAIVQGPTTLSVPREAMSLHNFNVGACLVGLILVIGMQLLREKKENA